MPGEEGFMGKKTERFPWLRLWCNFLDDPTVQRLSEVDQRRYLMLRILKRTGELAALRTIDDVAWRIRVTDGDLSAGCRSMSETVEALAAKGLICSNNGVLDIITPDDGDGE